MVGKAVDAGFSFLHHVKQEALNILQERTRKEDEEKPEETPADILLLCEIRDALKARG
jgi:large-conductance mechanosensitive channel